MKKFEEQYINNLKLILEEGNREYNIRTKQYTYRVPSTILKVDLSKELPILRTKKVYWKNAIDEILWIMQKQSNNVKDLNSKIWDPWARPDGSIGKTYGYQVNQITRGYNNQVEYILQVLSDDRSNRQAVIDLWEVKDLDDMVLVPCVYSSIWNIINNKLNCTLIQRSADYPIGVPFDILEYAVLTHLFARHLDVEVGILTHIMADSHIYENQIDGVIDQIDRYKTLDKNNNSKLIFKNNMSNDFWNIKIDDLDIINYDPLPPIKFDVAI